MAEKYKITYYMGAGASAMSIPVVADFKKVPEDLKKYLQENYPNKELKNDSRISAIIEIIDKFLLPFSHVSSMDTLAKRLFQIDDSGREYSQYKLFLELIFCYQHYYKRNDSVLNDNKGEPRYENLIRTIGEKVSGKNLKVEIPNNFNFVTWNYDILFENTILGDLKDKINEAKYTDTQNCILGIDVNEDIYSGSNILKLNRTAFSPSIANRIYAKHDGKIFSSIEEHFYNTLIKIYEEYQGRIIQNRNVNSVNNISFAWEGENDDKLRSQLQMLAYKTDIVVLIGYSFPTVNRLIDKAFFEYLQNHVKVYIQGRDYNDSIRTERLLKQCYGNTPPKFSTIPVESGDFFFVPSEYFDEKTRIKPRSPWRSN